MKTIKNCCRSNNKTKKCKRSDGKVFNLPRRFSKKRCITGPINGFTMRSSCAPFSNCKTHKGGGPIMLPKLRPVSNKNKKYKYKLEYPQRRRILAINEGVRSETKRGKSAKKAATAKKGRLNILRIYRRNKNIKDCNKITRDMRYIDKKYKLGKTKNICGKSKKQTGGKKTAKKQFLYNPDNPKLSFDVYIDKDPSDTIPIKYTTVEDVRDTIKKLERLYKNGKYSHKRIWQVGMIMKVRLEAIHKYRKTKYKNAKGVVSRYNLAKRYFEFLGKRTKIESDAERKQLVFK